MSEHFCPSFERRLCYLLAFLLLAVFIDFGYWQNGLKLTAWLVFFGEALELIFGKGYAFEVLPYDQRRSRSVLDFVLHPIILIAFAVSVLIALTSSTLGFVYPICVLVVALAMAAVYHLGEDEGPTNNEGKKIEPYFLPNKI